MDILNGAIWENWDDQWIVLMFLDDKYHDRLMVGWWLMTSATRIVLECDLIWQSFIHSTLSSLIKSASLFWRFGDRCTTSHGYHWIPMASAWWVSSGREDFFWSRSHTSIHISSALIKQLAAMSPWLSPCSSLSPRGYSGFLRIHLPRLLDSLRRTTSH